MASPSSSINITTFGPAGTKQNLREAGENILDTFCNSYPDSDTSVLLPELFDNNITELIVPKENLSRKQEDKICGLAINQNADEQEQFVFNLLVRLTRQNNIIPPLLIMRTFEMDANNPIDLKRKTLESCLPNIDFESFNTKGENDFVILVKNLGLVFIEVKSTNRESMKAEKQLENLNGIVQCIVKAMSGDKKRMIPTVKLIMIPGEDEEPSPIDQTTSGSYILFKDKCEKFDEVWHDIVRELSSMESRDQLSSAEFKNLAQFLVGLWSAKVLCTVKESSRSYNLVQEETDFNLVEKLKRTNEVIASGNVRNEKQFKSPEEKLHPLTKIERTQESDVFRSCNDVKLCYLTPDQRRYFDSCKQGIFRGSAGCGKSFLIIFKALELQRNLDPDQRILLLAPEPHNIRIWNTLWRNNSQVEMITHFPPSKTSNSIFVMNLKDFFNVKRDKLMEYNLENYHIFIDDAQDLKYVAYDDEMNFHIIANFVDQTHASCVNHDTYFWFMLDIAQGSRYINYKEGVTDIADGSHSHDLFLTPERQQRVFSIPIVELSYVMRNTESIMALTNEARENCIKGSSVSPVALSPPKMGHKVTSRVPVYHKLSIGSDKEQIILFMISRIREELMSVTMQLNPLPLSNIAIIYPFEHIFERYKRDIVTFLENEFGTSPQTIKEQLLTNNTTDIVMDAQCNIPSFEVPIVLFIGMVPANGHGAGRGGGTYYRIGSRSRVSLTIIDVGTGYPPSNYNNMDIVLWRASKNSNENSKNSEVLFTKYNCTCNYKQNGHLCRC